MRRSYIEHHKRYILTILLKFEHQIVENGTNVDLNSRHIRKVRYLKLRKQCD